MHATTQIGGDILIDGKDAVNNPINLPPIPPRETEVSLLTINDALLHRVPHPPDARLVGYPQSSHGISDYTFYTARDLGRFANGAVRILQESGLPKFSDPVENRVVAILALSNLDYVVALFALSRLGYAVLLLSTRLSTEAYTNLRRLIAIISFIPLRQKSHRKWAFIIHSSGSTGLPKPIFQTHVACIANHTTSHSYSALLTLLLYHNHGLCTFFRSLSKAKPIAIYNANLPLMGKNILEVMEIFRAERFHGVPYALKLLREVDGGVEALAKFQQVLFGGSSCPDDLGDYLVNRGVRLISHYGATELGQLMTSDRPFGDLIWNYVHPLKSAQPYLRMDELDDGSYECVVLDGLPAKVSSNCDDPPNSFRTPDTFLKHPSLPNAWKYLGRVDGRVTLVNGEKVLPVPIEHRIRQNKFMKDNLVFGVGKPLPGKEEILATVWPDIEIANQNAEAFSKISHSMVIVLDNRCTYPATDKGTMIRNRTYSELEDGPSSPAQKLSLGLMELEEYLLSLFQTDLGFTKLGLVSDLFEAGVDSLQAIKARDIIKNNIEIGSAELGHNVVFDFANIKKLAAHLQALRTGERQDEDDGLEVMSQLVDKYTVFVTRPKTEEIILLTGTTGSLGIYILSRLIQKDDVKKIYCLVRVSSPSNALDRILSNLASKLLPMVNVSKIVALPAQLSSEGLGLPSSTLSELRTTLTKHIRGVHNLINLCLSSDRSSPAQFYFCSSISAAAGTPLPANIGEAPIPEVGQIVGDTVTGKWNATEAIPLMLQTAHILNALPALDETPSCSASLRMSLHDPRTVYHVQNARIFKWTEELLPALKQAGLEFDVLPKCQWVQRLREGEQDPKKNPAIKLIGRSGLVFEMEKSKAVSPALNGGVELIESGLIKKFVDVWRSNW
ncbi:putative NRPS-like enzyme [Aspergillus cavernicola]|uniref:NRPS-like enzyme n=1 Tax=Aspergillus cavernicola TaxID=176166 RepID=A0ABR4ITR0_9EURO